MSEQPKVGRHGLTLGQYIRALRLGYYHMPGKRHGLLRMSPVPGGTFCEFHPVGQVPPRGQGGPEEHYVWWQDDGGAMEFSLSPYLRAIKEVRRPFTVTLDDDGMPVWAQGR